MSLTVSSPELLDGDSDALFRQVVHDSLGFAVRLDKGMDFVGREALVAAKAAGPRKRLRCLVKEWILRVLLREFWINVARKLFPSYNQTARS